MMVQLSWVTKVRGYFASQILSLTLRHEVSDIIPQDFEVVLTPFSFQAKVHLNEEMRTVFMKGKQFPIISNSATTGHKLQGCTLAELAVFEQFCSESTLLWYVTDAGRTYYLTKKFAIRDSIESNSAFNSDG